FAVNISIFVGYRLRRTKGAVVCTLGSVLPSFLIILLIALFFYQFKDNHTVERIFRGIRPAVVALIAAPTFRLAKSANLTQKTVWIPVISALLIWLLGVSPVYIIIVAGFGGYIYGRFYAGQDEDLTKTKEERERERMLEKAKKTARRKEKEYKKLQEKLEKSRREQEEAARKAEEARRKENEALQMIPQAREEAQKAQLEAKLRREEDRRIKAEQLGLFDVIDPRKVSEDNDPNNDDEEDDI
ncbi:MAG: chromate transporter, partial [Bacteroidaceae bacterium]|nr:chromate transporter [Bacteroidaceae bacterium]